MQPIKTLPRNEERALADSFAFGLEAQQPERAYRVEFRRGGRVQEFFEVRDVSREAVERKHRSMCAPGQSMLVTAIEDGELTDADLQVAPEAWRAIGAL